MRDRIQGYRAKAAEMRQRAADARERAAKESYLTIAKEYDELADSIESEIRRT